MAGPTGPVPPGLKIHQAPGSGEHKRKAQPKDFYFIRMSFLKPVIIL